jgi:Carboxypeptidase regulatory-like domain
MLCAHAGRFRRLAVIALAAVSTSACNLFTSDRSYYSLATEPEPEDPNSAPSVAIVAPAASSWLGEGVPIELKATVYDPDDNVSPDGVVWTSDRQGALGTGVDVTVPALEVGIHRVTVTVTDTEGASGADHVTVSVLPAAYGGENLPPVLEIAAPEYWEIFPDGGPIDFVGDGADPEEGPLPDEALRWSIGRASEPELEGTGRAITRTPPGPGSYRVDLKAADRWGTEAVETRFVLVGPLGACAADAPEVTPASLRLAPGAIGTVAVLARPRGDLPSAIVIVRLEDGENGLDEVFSYHFVNDPVSSGTSGLRRVVDLEVRPDVTPGETYTVDLALYYPNVLHPELTPFVCHVPLPVEIDGGAPNRPPEATFLAPDDHSTFVQGAAVVFEGTGTDPEDGTLSGSSLVWESTRDGILGTGSPLATTELSVGQHTISLTATDAGGLFSRAERIVTIAPPATTGSIRGRVSVLLDGMVYGWTGVTVTITGPVSRTTTTDASGRYSFSAVPSGAYTVSISGYPSYLSFSSTSKTVTVAGNTVDASFQGS